MRDIRVGIVGVGGMGSFHATTLAALAGVEVVAVADVYAPNASAVSQAVGAEVVDDPFELIRESEIDGLVIASPDETHPDFAIAAIGRGLFTLCEKPLAPTIDDARRTIDAELAGGRRLVQMGFMREYDPTHVQVVAELPHVGRIVALRTTHRNAKSAPRSMEVVVTQSIVHDVHSVHFLTGSRIESVHASTVADDDGSPRHVFVLCRLASDAHAVLEYDDSGFAYQVAVEVVGEHGDVLTGSPTRAVRRHDGSVDVHLGPDWFGWFADAYRRQDLAWVESIRDESPVGPSAWDGFVAQTVVDAILRSIESGETVQIPYQDRPPLYT